MACPKCGRTVQHYDRYCHWCGAKLNSPIAKATSKAWAVGKGIIVFFGTFMVYHIIFSSFFPVDENNVLQAPDWYTYVGMGLSLFSAIISASKRKPTQQRTSRETSNRPPIEPVLPACNYRVAHHALIESIDTEESTNSNRSRQERSELTHTQWLNYGGIEAELLDIDLMEGHDFEYWCASLLRKIGFYNVEVTQGSGDQGVDILAEKDGIRYAIQCKCYSKDLGNKPVQEVSSGKLMPEYHCQIGAVMTNRYFTKSAKDLANATGTLLWDRDWIKAHLQENSTCITRKKSKHPSTDALLESIMDEFFESGQVSVSLIQKKFGLDYQYASFVIQALEDHDFITPAVGDMPRRLNISRELWEKFKDSRLKP